MKIILFLGCFLTMSLVIPNMVNAQDFSQMLESKSYQSFQNHLDSEISIEIDRNSNSYSNQEAIAVIKEQLSKFKPVKWETIHAGQSESNENNYQIIKAYNAAGNDLRIFLYTKLSGSKKKISSVKFR